MFLALGVIAASFLPRAEALAMAGVTHNEMLSSMTDRGGRRRGVMGDKLSMYQALAEPAR